MADSGLLALVAAHERGRVTLAARTVARLAVLMAAMRDRWYDETAVTSAAGDMAAVVRAGQEATAGMTQGYLDMVLARLAVPVPRTGVVLPEENLRGVDALVQWARPAKVFRRAIADGASPLRAADLAQQRTTRMAEDDLTLAMREAARQRLEATPQVVGYRRVPRGVGSCDLCITASTRTYRRGDLLPIHGRCHCGVLPVVKGSEQESLLTPLKPSRRTRVAESVHGELGPYLHDARHDFRTHADAVADLNDPLDAA